MVSKGATKKRKRKSEHVKRELQLKRKHARSDKLQRRQGALFEDAGEQEIVIRKTSKRDKKGLDSNPEGEHQLNPNDSGDGNHNEDDFDRHSSRNGQVLDPKISKDEQCMSPKCRGNGLSESNKEVQDSKGQRLNPKRRKKEKNLKSEGSAKGHQPCSKSTEKEDNLKSDCSVQGDGLSNAKDKNEETLKVSMDVKENKKKKIKKKRDRWGQVLNDAGNTHDTIYDDKDALMLDNVHKPEDTAHEDGNGTVTECDSHEGDYDNKTVCAGGMPYDTSEQDIMSFFKECGTVARIVCMKFADTQRFKGLAFVTFETETAALKALSLDGANIGDRLIKVEKARAGAKALRAPPKREAGSLSVYVGNLDWNVKKIDMKRFFKGCDIDDVRLAVDKNTGDFRGYGHIDFSDERSLEKAIKMDQKQLLGRPVKVSYAVPKGFKGKSN